MIEFFDALQCLRTQDVIGSHITSDLIGSYLSEEFQIPVKPPVVVEAEILHFFSIGQKKGRVLLQVVIEKRRTASRHSRDDADALADVAVMIHRLRRGRTTVHHGRRHDARQ